MEILNPEIINQLNLLLKKRFVSIDMNSDMEVNMLHIFDKIKKFAKQNINFLIVINNETIHFENFYDELLNIINQLKNNNIKIVQTTASNNYLHSSHPYVHLYLWKTNNIRLSYKDSEIKTYVKLFEPNLYDKKPKFIKNKETKSILSMSRSNSIRDYLETQINKNDISIFRYDKEMGIDSIPWNELVNEYKKTFVSFISETNYGNKQFNCFTEKTIMSFLTGNIPIILGQKHLIKDLKKLGFWIANDDFGFEDGDEYSNTSLYRVDRFVNCINKISEMNLNDIKKYYTDNIDKINTNWEIVSTVFNYPKLPIVNKSII
jgi:hypothetical protein